ncbi:MAG: uracil-DNA glycosylase family protein [Negativicutes bacterium]
MSDTSKTHAFTNIDELEAALFACRACPLREKAIGPTSYNGDPSSPLMLVGEGPGGVEDDYGVPLVGPSGQLLDKALARVGITRDRVYTTNIVKCRPSGNRTPSVEEGEFCATRWLERRNCCRATQSHCGAWQRCPEISLSCESSNHSRPGQMVPHPA